MPSLAPDKHVSLGSTLMLGRILCSCGKVCLWSRPSEWAGHITDMLTLPPEKDSEPDDFRTPEYVPPVVHPHGYSPRELAATNDEYLRGRTEAQARSRESLAKAQVTGDVSFMVPSKSKLGQTTEYRRVEKRRERARKRGEDPDTMGPAYQLPKRGQSRSVGLFRRAASKVGVDMGQYSDTELRKSGLV